MSRIELDAADQGSVRRVREVLAGLEQADTGTASRVELLRLYGRALGQADILLRILDGGA
ncbi:hypothetical protein [Streptomyces sp. NPDC003832]